MKKLYLVLLLSATASAWAGDPPTPLLSQTNKPTAAQETGQTNAVPQIDRKSITQFDVYAGEMSLHGERSVTNKVMRGRVDADGIFVQLATTDNPLQLINPAAPERYGSPEDNIVRDSDSGKVSGLKFLELRF